MSGSAATQHELGGSCKEQLVGQCLHTYQPICGAGMMKPAHRDTFGGHKGSYQLVAFQVSSG